MQEVDRFPLISESLVSTQLHYWSFIAIVDCFISLRETSTGDLPVRFDLSFSTQSFLCNGSIGINKFRIRLYIMEKSTVAWLQAINWNGCWKQQLKLQEISLRFRSDAADLLVLNLRDFLAYLLDVGEAWQYHIFPRSMFAQAKGGERHI